MKKQRHPPKTPPPSLAKLKSERRRKLAALKSLEAKLPNWSAEIAAALQAHSDATALLATEDSNLAISEESAGVLDDAEFKAYFLQEVSRAYEEYWQHLPYLVRIFTTRDIESCQWFKDLSKRGVQWLEYSLRQTFARPADDMPESHFICNAFVTERLRHVFAPITQKRKEFESQQAEECERWHKDTLPQILPLFPWKNWPELYECRINEGGRLVSWRQAMQRWEQRIKRQIQRDKEDLIDWTDGDSAFAYIHEPPPIPHSTDAERTIPLLKQEISVLNDEILKAEAELEAVLHRHGAGRKVRGAAAAHFDKSRELAKSVRTYIELEAEQFPMCSYCGGPLGSDWNADHIYPVSRGGLSTRENMVAICAGCNNKKSDLTLRDFLLIAGLEREACEDRLAQMGKVF